MSLQAHLCLCCVTANCKLFRGRSCTSLVFLFWNQQHRLTVEVQLIVTGFNADVCLAFQSFILLSMKDLVFHWLLTYVQGVTRPGSFTLFFKHNWAKVLYVLWLWEDWTRNDGESSACPSSHHIIIIIVTVPRWRRGKESALPVQKTWVWSLGQEDPPE